MLTDAKSALTEWEKARAGEIVAVAIAARYRDGSNGTSLTTSGKDNALAGALFGLMRDVAS